MTKLCLKNASEARHACTEGGMSGVSSPRPLSELTGQLKTKDPVGLKREAPSQKQALCLRLSLKCNLNMQVDFCIVTCTFVDFYSMKYYISFYNMK